MLLLLRVVVLAVKLIADEMGSVCWLVDSLKEVLADAVVSAVIVEKVFVERIARAQAGLA
jgi:hypothetical protein